MRKVTKIFLCLQIFSVMLYSSCSYGLHEVFFRDGHVGKRANKIVQIEKPATLQNETQYSFAVITDVHFGADKTRPDESFFSWLTNTAEKPKFVICLGDAVERGTETEYEAYKNFCQKVKNICGSEVYSVVGNHDLYNSGWNVWQKNVFPHTSFYFFETNKFSFYFLDSASAFFGSPQISALKNRLAFDAKPKLIFTHVPLYSKKTVLGYFSVQHTNEADEMLSLFAKSNVKAVFEGHFHDGEKIALGAFELLNVPAFLEYKKFALVTVDEVAESVSIEILSL